MNLVQWAIKWGVSLAALEDLGREIGLHDNPEPDEEDAGKSEAFAQSQVMLEAPYKGVRLWRNNVGALTDKGGRLVRYGLANDSKRVNELVKSSDLIGIRKVLIEPAHVGTYIGQFVSRECKHPGWQYTADDHEKAQLNWLMIVNSMGGDAKFATGAGTL